MEVEAAWVHLPFQNAVESERLFGQVEMPR